MVMFAFGILVGVTALYVLGVIEDWYYRRLWQARQEGWNAARLERVKYDA